MDRDYLFDSAAAIKLPPDRLSNLIDKIERGETVDSSECQRVNDLITLDYAQIGLDMVRGCYNMGGEGNEESAS